MIVNMNSVDLLITAPCIGRAEFMFYYGRWWRMLPWVSGSLDLVSHLDTMIGAALSECRRLDAIIIARGVLEAMTMVYW